MADKVTSIRLILAPVFFVIYLLPEFFPPVFALSAAEPLPPDVPGSTAGAAWTVPVLWIIFVLSEITDMLDGMVARARKEVSDFGKLFDPFADTLTQITYFSCFVLDGILPPVLFLVVIFREFGILFVRNLMLKKGIAMGARIAGKVKTVTYIAAAGLALLASSAQRLAAGGELFRWAALAANVVFALSVILAVVSFLDYLAVLVKTPETR